MNLKRNIYQDLYVRTQKEDRKPLILKGARQVGKSFAIEQFAKNNRIKLHKINFQSQKDAFDIFEGNQDSDSILTKIEFFLDEDIDLENDLLFLDEIQECPKAVNSLKFLGEEKPQLKIISAGSYLGLMKNQESFPVGKVEYMSMFPLSFDEFLLAVDEKLYNFFKKIDVNNMNRIDDFFHKKLLDKFYLYLAVGGMPEVVLYYVQYSKSLRLNQILNNIREKQKNLLESYKSDFAKHGGTVNSNHILNVFESIPIQLSKTEYEETDKFKFTGIIPNQKGYNVIKEPLTWLTKARLAIQSFLISDIQQPLKAEAEKNKFKLFMHDIGLLNTELDIPITSLLNITDEVGSYKGYIVENFVACELFNIFDQNLYTWQRGKAEVEFVVNIGEYIIPIECKSSVKSRRAKSLDSFVQRYAPKYAYKFTAQNYGKKNGFETIPLYLVGKVLRERKY